VRVIRLVFSLDDSFVQKRSDEVLEHQSFSLQMDWLCFGDGTYYAYYGDRSVVASGETEYDLMFISVNKH